jgi:hypothetical protein
MLVVTHDSESAVGFASRSAGQALLIALQKNLLSS